MSNRFFPALGSSALILHVACGGEAGGAPEVPPPFDSGPDTQAAGPLGRGVNLGNMLEAPNEGDWGHTVQQDDFRLIKDKGFDTVRIPIRWSAHALTIAPYTIDAAFFTRVDEVVGWAQAQDLNILINCHHWLPEEALFTDPDANHDRFVQLWKQIATHFKKAPSNLYLEILNEPHGNLNATKWNALLADAVGAVRAIDATRTVILGGVGWNSASALGDLEIPLGETRVIATYHFYSPFPFTHQGAEWADPIPPTGVLWPGMNPESACAAIQAELDIVASWALNHPGIPILMGEFGAYSKGDLTSRAHWTAYVRKQAETRGFSWAYWEFCAGFGVYDREAGAWNAELTAALGLNP